jgi:hypothetical protein
MMGMVAGLVELEMTVVGWFVAGLIINAFESMQLKMGAVKDIVSDGLFGFGGTRVVVVVVMMMLMLERLQFGQIRGGKGR